MPVAFASSGCAGRSMTPIIGTKTAGRRGSRVMSGFGRGFDVEQGLELGTQFVVGPVPGTSPLPRGDTILVQGPRLLDGALPVPDHCQDECLQAGGLVRGPVAAGLIQGLLC